MLYLETSALIKQYVREGGSEKIRERVQEELGDAKPVFTSVLTFAEVHSAVAQRRNDKSLSKRAFLLCRQSFEADWLGSLSAIALDSSVLSFIRDILETHPLKGTDAVHLASALWLRDTARVNGKLLRGGEPIIFASSDRHLTTAAQKYKLEIFNPETP